MLLNEVNIVLNIKFFDGLNPVPVPITCTCRARILFYYIYICRYKGCSHDTSNDSIELISVSVSSLLDVPVLSTPPLYCWDTVYCKIIINNNVTLGTGVKYFGNITGKRVKEEERGRAGLFCAF